MDFLEHIDINTIRGDLRKKYSLEIDSDNKVRDILLKGVSFRNTELKVDIQDYYNHLAGRTCQHFYFICPECLVRCRKIYVSDNNKLACRKCSKIKSKFKVNSQADRVLRIQLYLGELFNKHITSQKRKQLVKNITNHYQELDSKYKMMYNTIAFKELQKWCLAAVQNKETSSDYKKAAKDMLVILRDVRKVLVFSGLSISKNDKLKI